MLQAASICTAHARLRANLRKGCTHNASETSVEQAVTCIRTARLCYYRTRCSTCKRTLLPHPSLPGLRTIPRKCRARRPRGPPFEAPSSGPSSTRKLLTILRMMRRTILRMMRISSLFGQGSATCNAQRATIGTVAPQVPGACAPVGP